MNIKKLNDYELVYFLFLVSVCSAILGLCVTKSLGLEFGNFNDIQEILLGTNPGILYFFKKNLLFFLLISITPFINIFLIVIQFLQVGFMIAQIENLNILSQTMLLYRHLIFEMIGLFIAAVISFKYIHVIQCILKDKEINKTKYVKCLTYLYAIIVIATMMGALLEGTAYA